MAKALWALTAATLAVALGCGLVFVATTLAVRVPYWGEAEVLFEASRIREGLPLFVDPLVGAHEYGEPPSRYLVTYPPVWALLVALVPRGAALVTSRVACTLAWLGSLGAIAATAPRANRPNAIACAAYVAGSWILLNFATVGRPDSIACALAAAGLVRATRRGRIDLVSGALLVAVPWVKPTLLGLPLGAFAGDALARRSPAPALSAAAATAALAVVAHLASGGVLFAHVAGSNAQPFTLAAWMNHVPTRLPFFAPLFALAAYVGWRGRRSPGSVVALGALAASVIWVLAALAKTGSASNYWMEPCIAALVVVAHATGAQADAEARGAFRFGASGAAHAALALVAALYAAVSAVRASIEHARDYREDAAVVASIRGTCGAEGVVVADEAGVEIALDGRILVPAYQMAHRARVGRFAADVWARDLASPRVACVVEHTGDLRLVPELARAIDDGFTPARESRGFRVLVRRGSLHDAQIDPPPDR